MKHAIPTFWKVRHAVVSRPASRSSNSAPRCRRAPRVEASRTFVVPEPAYLALLVPGVAAVAAVGLLGRRRRRR